MESSFAWRYANAREGEFRFRLRQNNGKIICWIENNRFYLKSDRIFRMDKTPHRLTVFNDEARMIFDVEFINERAVRLLGDFYLRNGARVLITPDRQDIGLIHITTPTVFGDCKFSLN